MTTPADAQMLGLGAVGILGGVGLLARGFAGYRQAGRIGDTATSRISGLAVGEVRVSGSIETAEVQLTSPLQSRPCVYYRSTVVQSEGRESRRIFHEERSVGFRVRDETGALRVFPLGARWDVPDRYTDRDGLMSGPPAGLSLRVGPSIRMARIPEDDQSDPIRAMQIADLLTVHGTTGGDNSEQIIGAGGQGRQYREAALEVGETVTIVGTVLRFDQLADPTAADQDLAIMEPAGPGAGDPEIAADLAEAREAGTLADDARSAWGNAAIPGFGVGRPVTAPTLDPDATAPVIEPGMAAEAAQSAARTFDIAADTLVLAAGADRPMLIAAGTPGASAGRGAQSFLIGLMGAVLAIASAVAVAIAITGGAPR